MIINLDYPYHAFHHVIHPCHIVLDAKIVELSVRNTVSLRRYIDANGFKDTMINIHNNIIKNLV